ncbi:lysozyme [Zavarzinella formosa]|uniref:lysozyme n=1 Tax=Zavarzinella formosa TaxID=360055 RepID=UPI0002F1C549|nr:lysozyme [Zavarzinella formosa]
MKCNEDGLQIVRDCEGLKLKAYRDSAGVLTIGHGHTGKDVQPNSRIDEHTAEVLLAQDMAKAEAAVNRLVRVPLNENQFSALCSFVFNLGEGNLRGSKSVDALNRKGYIEFASRMLLWDKARVDGELKTLPGLTKRREMEKNLFLRPVVVK